MDQINKIELCGIVGSARKDFIENSGAFHAAFTVATNYAYRGDNGDPVIETTWHRVEAFTGREIKEETLRTIDKGCKVHVIGRLRNVRYIGGDGIERTMTEIIATCVEIV